MSNDFLVVLFADQESANHWSFDQVTEHWHRLFSGNLLSQCYLSSELPANAELAVLEKTVAVWCQRFYYLSRSILFF